jgi:RHS repeat-associated protein
MPLPGRKANPGDYRYGFNGKELDDDGTGMGGGGNTYDYGFRIYNPQIAKFLSVDPLSSNFPFYTPYQFAANTPIMAIDLDGLESVVVINSNYFTKKLTEALKIENAEQRKARVNELVIAALKAPRPDNSNYSVRTYGGGSTAAMASSPNPTEDPNGFILITNEGAFLVASENFIQPSNIKQENSSSEIKPMKLISCHPSSPENKESGIFFNVLQGAADATGMVGLEGSITQFSIPKDANNVFRGSKFIIAQLDGSISGIGWSAGVYYGNGTLNIGPFDNPVEIFMNSNESGFGFTYLVYGTSYVVADKYWYSVHGASFGAKLKGTPDVPVSATRDGNNNSLLMNAEQPSREDSVEIAKRNPNHEVSKKVLNKK